MNNHIACAPRALPTDRRTGTVHCVTEGFAPTACECSYGTAGIARFGVLCNNAIGSAVTYYTGADSTWLTFAHEIGHNLGGYHSFEDGVGTTGGIMDYGDGVYNGVFQFNAYGARG
jgi:hypothetical protein